MKFLIFLFVVISSVNNIDADNDTNLNILDCNSKPRINQFKNFFFNISQSFCNNSFYIDNDISGLVHCYQDNNSSGVILCDEIFSMNGFLVSCKETIASCRLRSIVYGTDIAFLILLLILFSLMIASLFAFFIQVMIRIALNITKQETNVSF